MKGNTEGNVDDLPRIISRIIFYKKNFTRLVEISLLKLPVSIILG